MTRRKSHDIRMHTRMLVTDRASVKGRQYARRWFHDRSRPLDARTTRSRSPLPFERGKLSKNGDNDITASVTRAAWTAGMRDDICCVRTEFYPTCFHY